MTKKQTALATVFLTVALCVVFLLVVPLELVEDDPGHWPLYVLKIGFLSVCFGVAISLLLVAVTRRDYLRMQFASMKKYRHLLKLLVKRDFVSRYKRSVLGVLWSLLNPLLTMLVMTMVFSLIFARDIPNFPVYLLSGQLIFSFFSESTNQAMLSVLNGAPIIQKVYVPKYIFPVSRVLSSLVNLGFSFLAFLLVFVVTRQPFSWTMLLCPIPVVYTFLFSVGVAMLLSALSVFFRDLVYLYGIFLMLLNYLTPIFYPVTILPDWVRQLLGLNPMYHFVDYFRKVALNGMLPTAWDNIVCIGFALIALCTGVYVFMSKQDRFILYF